MDDGFYRSRGSVTLYRATVVTDRHASLLVRGIDGSNRTGPDPGMQEYSSSSNILQTYVCKVISIE